jgi:hypothetical protein
VYICYFLSILFGTSFCMHNLSCSLMKLKYMFWLLISVIILCRLREYTSNEKHWDGDWTIFHYDLLFLCWPSTNSENLWYGNKKKNSLIHNSFGEIQMMFPKHIFQFHQWTWQIMHTKTIFAFTYKLTIRKHSWTHPYK